MNEGTLESPVIHILGTGAVSPAGWGTAALMEALRENQPIRRQPLARPGWQESLFVRPVPPPPQRPAFYKHPRLRRASPITHYAAAAAWEALGSHLPAVQSGDLRTGVVLATMSGSVQYSRRFYGETLQDPATASPLVFPETVFNAPASHVASLLGTTAVDYTLVGDTVTFFQGLAVAAQWLIERKVDACLVVGAEETDWTTADAFHLFDPKLILSAGAGALLLTADSGKAHELGHLDGIAQPRGYRDALGRDAAMSAVREDWAGASSTHTLLCDGLQDVARFDRAEDRAWRDWTGPRISPKRVLGEGLTAATAWQCVAALQLLQERSWPRAIVTNAGCNQQAGGASFTRADSPAPSKPA